MPSTAAVAGIDRDVSLDEVLIVGDPHIVATKRADDSAGHCLVKPKGTANGNDPFADLRQFRIGPFDGLELACFNF